ncbi:hypothetical protein PAHAL_9G071000 [Panicum hallii]|uniref:RRM domain-containing protein n=1 Tax=Panicum hallii TaxID=206008 RepID=A0A2S3IHP0_9POAL|nr:RNA-binding protein Musashi homolog 2-like [Panicum hallii]PAN44799.1 hypothetical protein PAHAL_9G071000 [Panicum hallii]
MEQAEHEPRKLFVGGLPRCGVTQEGLRAHFARYGHVVEALVMQYPDGMGRGFGFIEFQDEEAALRALDARETEAHDAFFGRKVDVKKAEKKQGTRSAPTQSSSYKRDADPKKIFVGGLGDRITRDDLSGYFEKFGTITDAVVCHDKLTRKARGFGFVTFDSQEAADKVLENRFHHLKGTKVETTHAKPRSSMDGGGWGHRSPANDYGGMYSPHNGPFVPCNGPYLVPYPYPYLYASPGMMNYGYVMNQIGTSNDTGMIVMRPPPTMYAHYGSSYGHDAANLKLQSDSGVMGNQPSAGLKSDPAKPDSNLP